MLQCSQIFKKELSGMIIHCEAVKRNVTLMRAGKLAYCSEALAPILHLFSAILVSMCWRQQLDRQGPESQITQIYAETCIN